MFSFQDVSDLFGADLPVDGGKCGEFQWVDGPLLAGLKAGHWIVLDEVSRKSAMIMMTGSSDQTSSLNWQANVLVCFYDSSTWRPSPSLKDSTHASTTGPKSSFPNCRRPSGSTTKGRGSSPARTPSLRAGIGRACLSHSSIGLPRCIALHFINCFVYKFTATSTHSSRFTSTS